jgi:glutathione S-transferase
VILRTSITSPFGRKARVAATHLGLMDRFTIEPAEATNPDDPLRKDNPLGKMPVMTLDDGRKVYDSRVILEQLDHMAGAGKILPVEWDARLNALTLQALADGIMDAAILIVYEGRHRPAEIHHKPWLDYQLGKVERGLTWLATNQPDPKQVTVGTISTACALGYIDWRKQTDWRGNHPSLIKWLDAFRATAPSFDATTPPV